MKTNQTNSIRPSMFSVQCWLLNVAVFAIANSALADVHYVDVNSTNATPPYTSWSTAATNIQDAVDAARAGDEVVVTNGVYATGSRDNEAGTSRVVVDKPLNLRSVNGPQFTFIDGGGFGRRCVYLTNSATLSGFTLTNGVIIESRLTYVNGGGGVWCAASDTVVSNCVITGNQVVAYGDYLYSTSFVAYGGGAAGGTLNDCMLTGNSTRANAEHSLDKPEAQGGGAYGCTLNNCTLSGNSASAGSQGSYSDVTVHAAGGGAYGCTLNNCTLSGNTAIVPNSGSPFGDARGGGASYSTVNSCAFTGNSAIGNISRQGFNSAAGGGASHCTLNNCTLAGNSAWGFSGGVYASTLNNCIVYYNTALHYATWQDDDYGYGSGSFSEGTLNYCCTMPQPTNGVGNITNAPLFVDTNGWTNLRLQPNSPCINAGDNSSVTGATDLDGNPRNSGGTVDIGAYEYQWPQLTLTPSDANVILTWPTNNLGYDYTGFTVQSTTNLIPPLVWTTNAPAPVVINGQNTVTNPITGNQMYFRLSE
jgi:hypothetical protein